MFVPLNLVLDQPSNLSRISQGTLWALLPVALWLSDVPLQSVLPFLGGIIMLFYWQLASLEKIDRLVWNAQTETLFIEISTKKRLNCSLPKQLLHTPWFVLIQLQADERLKPQWLMIWRDQLSKANWRRLRVLARFGALAERKAL